jgi:hypothetical protein
MVLRGATIYACAKCNEVGQFSFMDMKIPEFIEKQNQFKKAMKVVSKIPFCGKDIIPKESDARDE